jgi:uncharacterized protein (DUF488 family)
VCPPLKTPDEVSRRIFTVGHSTHPIEEFLVLLGAHRIAVLADVRSFPSSRRWPHFNQEELKRAVERAGIEYLWLKLLGGRRHSARADSPHTAWTHPAFRSYADWADGADFARGLEELEAAALRAPTACMCSEGLWWRCHRRIIADHLVLRGWTVEHIMPNGKLVRHSLSSFARVEAGRLVYDGIPPTDDQNPK